MLIQFIYIKEFWDNILKLLHVISSVDPKCGGPIEGINQLSSFYRTLGVDVSICSSDAPDAECVKNSQTTVHALGPVTSKYGYNSRLVPWLKEHAQNYDAVIVNGLWQYHGFAAWRAFTRLGRPYVVFTHGMLDPWFARQYPLKHLKKWLYWPWAEYRVVRVEGLEHLHNAGEMLAWPEIAGVAAYRINPAADLRALAALEADAGSFEVLVVDDGSADRTSENALKSGADVRDFVNLVKKQMGAWSQDDE